jgi:mannose-1-phosphate guanylyltransferase
MNEHAYAVILAGGRGERFWPLSTQAHPKQFIALFGGRPLLTLAIDRLEGVIPAERIFVITSADLVAATREAAWNVPVGNIVGEPCGRDTAAASALACALVRRHDPNGTVCILTADQLMSDLDTFRQTLRDGIQVAAASDVIVTIGIVPTYAATGFGYIEAGSPLSTSTATVFHQALRFVEKPDDQKAASYVAGGRHFWNAGMFIWQARVMTQALLRHAPPLAALCDRVASARESELPGLLAELYPGLPRISVDYAIMEHADNMVMARGMFGWDDVGTWTSLAGHFPPDADANVCLGACESLDARGNVVVSENRLTALLGVRDLIVVQSATTTLVCARDRAQDVKQLVARVARRPDGAKYL